MNQPFHEWIADTRRSKGLRQEDCVERVNREFPTKRSKRHGDWIELPAMTRQAWHSLEKYPSKRVNPDTIRKVAVGLGEPESIVVNAAPQYSVVLNEADTWRIDFGKRLQRAREGRYTQVELGQMTGLGRQTIANYENATAHPPAYAVYRLVQELGVDANVLLGLRPGELGMQETAAPKEGQKWESRLEDFQQHVDERFERMFHLLESRVL